MTFQDAIKEVKSHIILADYINEDYIDCVKRETMIACINAMEKQIPQKPKEYIAYDGIKRKGCPTCDHNEILCTGQKYCSICGQAIDWDMKPME